MDRRLWTALLSVRRLFLLVASSGLAIGALIVLQASLLATIVSRVYIGQQSFIGVWPLSRTLLLVILVRATIVGLSETWSCNLATDTQITLRERLLAQLLDSGPLALQDISSGTLVTTAIQGIDDLEVFLARYLPQIAFTACIPLVIWIRTVSQDWISGLILLITLPLIPLFMILIGRQAKDQSQRRWETLTRLNGHFLDILHGLETLKLFGRSKRQAEAVYRASDQFRLQTMTTLRVAFLSAMVLELLASLSMAFIAVAIGLRLISGVLSFKTGFMLLILVPEFYIPWRALGARFHDGLKGATAARQIFDILEAPAWAHADGTHRLSSHGPWPLHFEAVGFTYPGRQIPALQDVTFDVSPGEHIALVGPSGSGKSTLLTLLLGLGPHQGEIRIGRHQVGALDPLWWRQQVAWVTQHPYLFDATVLENLRMVRPDASRQAIAQALSMAQAESFVAALPEGLDTPIGQEGFRLSSGQRQRLALARAFLQDAPYVILDEATQSLDVGGEETLTRAIQALTQGRTALMVAHRLRTVLEADRIWVLQSGQMVQSGTPQELGKLPGVFFLRGI